MNNFDKAFNNDGPAVKYLWNKFAHRNDAKIKKQSLSALK